MFNIFINNIGGGIESTLSKSAADSLEEKYAILRVLGGLEKWTRVNLMEFNKANC